MRVKQLFGEREIHAAPVVSEDGRLLGDYTRGNDLICRENAEVLCADPYVLQKLKENGKGVFLVEVRGGGYIKKKCFCGGDGSLKA